MSAPDAPIHVRPGREADATVIARFQIQLARETEGKKLDPYVVERGVRRVFAGGTGARYFVADSAGEVVGCCMTTGEWSDWRNGMMWWLQSVYVRPEDRGRGVFRAMLAEAERAALADGAACLRLYVEHDNARARQTYHHAGFAAQPYEVMEKPL